MTWKTGTRLDPESCNEKDLGKFEISVRDGQARLGKLYTKHGVVETPCLLPVINPNIMTIKPREMWDKYGIKALITNSYVIWKHEKLKLSCLENGVHKMLDYPGAIMTDSGTFQSYVYGDVEVEPDEIVSFQKNIGVDIATMLDVFTRPDMTFNEVKHAVLETINRAQTSIDSSKGIMLNGPIQGGVYHELRKKSAIEMCKFDFAIHPIGGIVPIMEQQKYKELLKIMLVSKSNLKPNRPVHMFGCGHPMLFPILIAMGADLFDSAAYVLFARDGRLLTPWGTEKLSEIEEWPLMMPAVSNLSPKDVRDMDKITITEILARFNLEVTLQELARCRQAVRNGEIWQLAERRSHQNPALREAFLWLITSPAKIDMLPFVLDEKSASKDLGKERGIWEENWDWFVTAQNTPKKGAEAWGGLDTFNRPHVEMAKRRLNSRWKSRKNGKVIVFYGTSPPWRNKIGDLINRLCGLDCDIFISTPVGLIPFTIEDMNPWAHIEGPSWIWKKGPDYSMLRVELEKLGIKDRDIVTIDISNTEDLHKTVFERIGHSGNDSDPELRHSQSIIDKLCILFNLDYKHSESICKQSKFVMSNTGRVKNMIDYQGIHLFSQRLVEGGLSLTVNGAKRLHQLRSMKIPSKLPDRFAPKPGEGPPWIVVNSDAEPFIEQGRNVMHGFVIAYDSWVRPGEGVLIVNSNGKLLGFGTSQSTCQDLKYFNKGIAVKVRQGCP